MRKIVRHERIAITQRTMPALKTPQADTVLWDRKLQRFGVRLTPGGAISFLIQFRNRAPVDHRHLSQPLDASSSP